MVAGLDVSMNYDMMEQMYQLFKQGADQLDQTARAMENLAGVMEGGAFLGKAGDMFADALRTRLAKKIDKLKDKFEELAGDVIGALVDLRDGDTSAASRFKG